MLPPSQPPSSLTDTCNHRGLYRSSQLHPRSSQPPPHTHTQQQQQKQKKKQLMALLGD